MSAYRKIISLIVVVFMLVGILPVYAVAGTATEQSLGEIGYGSNGKFIAAVAAPNPSATPIYTAQDLWNVRNNLGGSFVLKNNIDLSSINNGVWEPIGTNSSTAFTGSFDGQGYVIHNLKVTSDRTFVGLFGYVNDASIMNVGLENTLLDINSAHEVYAGGICGFASSASITNCYNAGSVAVTSSSIYVSSAGGIAGFASLANGAMAVSDCYNLGAITVSSLSSASAGGIIGYASSSMVPSASFMLSVSGCSNAGDVSTASSATSSSGGIIGYAFSYASALSLTDCKNAGTIESDSSSVNAVSTAGGIIGYSFSSGEAGFEIARCYSTGEASSVKYAGGICGYSVSTSGSIHHCYNTGKVTSGGYAGGINGYTYVVGFSDALSAFSVDMCYNVGEVTSTSSASSSYIGGISGSVDADTFSTITLRNCYSTGNLASSAQSGDAILGGIVGSSNGTTMTHCYWNADGNQVVKGTSRPNVNKVGVGAFADSGTDTSTSLSASAMKDRTNYALNYAGFSFSTDWCFISNQNNGYPMLRAFFADVSGVELSETVLSKEVGETFALSAVVVPYDIFPAISWSSSNTSVATVNSEGVVTTHALGTAIISATVFEGGYSASCQLNVYDPNGPLVHTSKVVARAGQEMTIAITLEKNPGISNYGIVMQFDSAVFSYISSAVGDVLTENFVDSSNEGLADNQIRFRANTTAGGTADADGTLFTVTLKIAADLLPGEIGSDRLTFMYVDSRFDGFTLIEEIHEWAIIRGEVTINNVYYGDVNGDDTLNGIDQTWMNQFFSGLLSTTNRARFVEANADVDGSGALNGIDQTRMNRFFSGLDNRPFGPAQ